MLTFEALRSFSDEEMKSPGLSKLPQDFYSQAHSYLEGKEKIGAEFETARNLLQDIREKRERKVLLAALYFVRSGVQPANLLGEERHLFEKVSQVLKELKGSQKNPEIEFLQPLPAFVGPDMKTYGPFKPGDKASLPEDLASLLISKNAAKG